MLHIRSGFFERIPDELPLNVLFAVVINLLRRRVHFAGNAGEEGAKDRAVDRARRLLQVRWISGLPVQRTERALSWSYPRLAWGAGLA